MPETVMKGQVVYSVDGNRIFRDDGIEKETVAMYDPKSGVVELLPGKTNYRVAVVRHLNDKGHKYTTVGKIGMDIDRSKAPPKPKMSRVEGEKTAEVVEWYAKYFPEEFLLRYDVRELQVRTGFREDVRQYIDKRSGDKVTERKQVPTYGQTEIPLLDFDLQKVKNGEQRLIGGCKTHITDKVSAGTNSDDYDDELDAKIQRQQEAARKGGLI